MLRRSSVVAVLWAAIASVPASAEVLRIEGTGNGMELIAAVGAAYAAKHPSVRILLPPSIHTSGGIKALMEGKATLARIGRPLTAEEQAAGLRATPIAKIPPAVIVNSSVTVNNVSAQQLAALFSGRIRNWQELGGPDLRVRLVRRQETDATLMTMRAQLPGWATLNFPEKSRLAATAQEAISFVQSAPGAIGFTAYNRELDSHLVVLRVDGRHPFDDAYPFATVLHLAHREAMLTSEAKGFIAFWRTEPARDLVKRLGAKLVDP